MRTTFLDHFLRGCVLGGALAGVLALWLFIVLIANGYTLTRQPPEPVLVPIDCKVTA